MDGMDGFMDGSDLNNPSCLPSRGRVDGSNRGEGHPVPQPRRARTSRLASTVAPTLLTLPRQTAPNHGQPRPTAPSRTINFFTSPILHLLARQSTATAAPNQDLPPHQSRPILSYLELSRPISTTNVFTGHSPLPSPDSWLLASDSFSRTLDACSRFIGVGLRTSDGPGPSRLGSRLPHDSFSKPTPENQWILTLFKIPTSIPARIFKGFTT